MSETSLWQLDSLTYIDKTLDNCADLPSDLPWRNEEVIEVLRDIRKFILDDVEPPLFTQSERDTMSGVFKFRAENLNNTPAIQVCEETP
jgi:hypothetical protein